MQDVRHKMGSNKVSQKLKIPQTMAPEHTQPTSLMLVPLSDDERRAYVWERRLKGFSYDAVYRDMLETFSRDVLPKDWSPKRVYADCSAILSQIQNEYKETAAEMVDIELGRFDEMLAAIWPAAKAGDLGAVDKVLSISRERRKMMGLDNPEMININWKVQVADLLQRGLVTPQDVAGELGEEALISVNQYLLERKEVTN